ncbi:helix-turn-helix domain-containing protein [Ginsengibacter hankyongi]|uniref:Helix-turn-helix domain-containing protein n=1 Tax=Ginsengibacter hankyongi TaxID=2607284 RepID=A0A5J5IQ06_9BACT|nr:helix-turn-helix domain-containing protein [Ginsengibacter hankyongi]KAA9041622.1 helix-turn-helix domain-containing protein [Ginsengibacter hankyongi]
MSDNYLTRKQVANKLQVVPKTVKNWTDKGILNSHKIGRVIRYKESEVNSAISTGTDSHNERNTNNG